MIELRRFGLIITSLVVLSINYQSYVNADIANEDEIKAAYLFHILHFVNWPPHQDDSDTSPINICVMGHDRKNQSLQKLASKTVSKHEIKVQFLNLVSQNIDCQLLFARHTPFDKISGLLHSTAEKAVLIVGDSPGFAKEGGMIGFVLSEGTIRIEINLGTIKKAGFEVSANLLEVAVKIINAAEEGS